ncbi:hypothetical protein DFA_01135 [Cavenderia fasciculata]|uniref:Uncharacterized protein n=1 Tax=Cavenderia fasciculata TaxID=261658 RepID=F4PQZ1_CACFS|nr:uncharacterized protein DFA_01135 [Cavenderia fasciculata]EGG21256.1 hypothetical protein DFA_01135 [Cavenderia fasciculata]|eukprot:XP_004359106.1 hypothetical protein DFA_01135 [Cavenderia fasciculata]
MVSCFHLIRVPGIVYPLIRAVSVQVGKSSILYIFEYINNPWSVVDTIDIIRRH